jgi:hypothetical protein
MEPDHPSVLAAADALAAADRGVLRLWVEWGSLRAGPGQSNQVELVVRAQGSDEPIASARSAIGEPCDLELRVREPGAMYLALLRPLPSSGSPPAPPRPGASMNQPAASSVARCAAAGELGMVAVAAGETEPNELRAGPAVGVPARGASWSRSMHVLAPFPAEWRNQRHVCYTRLKPALEMTVHELRDLAAPPLPLLRSPAAMLPERGYGLELELLSVPPQTDVGHFSKQAEWTALLDAAAAATAAAGTGRAGALAASCPPAEAPTCSPGAAVGSAAAPADETVRAAPPDTDAAADAKQQAELARLVERLRRWQISLDPACLPFPAASARLLLPRMRALGEADAAGALALLTERSRSVPTEYKSPLPPHELRFGSATTLAAARGGDGGDCAGAGVGPGVSESAQPEIAEVTLGLRMIGRLAVCAPSVSESGVECNTALHVHVNALSPTAAGRALSAREILAVWLSWVRFELVTMRWCRSWCWADRWAAPLYATGSEFTFSERPLVRGQAGQLGRGLSNDVPAFFAHAFAVLPELDTLPDDGARVARLFGDGCKLGKYCSLNLLPLRSYGTLEFRRQHASTDDAFIARWAHFCVAFVEAHADAALVDRYADGSIEEGLDRLQRDQWLASVGGLMERLGPYVSEDLPDYMRECGCGPHVLPSAQDPLESDV